MATPHAVETDYSLIDQLDELLTEYETTVNPAPYTTERALYERLRHLVPRSLRCGGKAHVVSAVAEGLLHTDALTGNHDGTPEHYIVEADNLEYLVTTVLDLSDDVLREMVDMQDHSDED